MSTTTRWSYLTIEIKPGMMGGFKADAVQDVLETQGRQGWELVNLVITSPVTAALAVFKKES